MFLLTLALYLSAALAQTVAYFGEFGDDLTLGVKEVKPSRLTLTVLPCDDGLCAVCDFEGELAVSVMHIRETDGGHLSVRSLRIDGALLTGELWINGHRLFLDGHFDQSREILNLGFFIDLPWLPRFRLGGLIMRRQP